MPLGKPPAAHPLGSVSFRRHPAVGNGARGPDGLRHGGLQIRHLIRLETRYGQFHIADLGPQMEGRGGPPEAVLGHGRQQVLARVLLHVIEAPLPVQTAHHRAFRNRLRQHVADLPIPLDNLQHRHAAKETAVGRLAPALRIEDRVLENREGAPCFVPRPDHPGFDPGLKIGRAHV